MQKKHTTTILNVSIMLLFFYTLYNVDDVICIAI